MDRRDQLPIVDLALFDGDDTQRTAVAKQVREACCQSGFFYLIGHGVDDELMNRLETLSREFFSLSPETKNAIHMSKGGKAWRGYFSVGEELTSGVIDRKEGLYFGAELDEDHPMVKAGVPLHGANLFPSLSGFRDVVLSYMKALTGLGHTLMELIALSLDLDGHYFRRAYGSEPTTLFRVFNYPPIEEHQGTSWSVGEHTDYGILTILRQDHLGGLQVKNRGAWIDAPPIPGTFVINLGDMLERMTGGLFKSTPHRVFNSSAESRLSWPFFFDPNFEMQVEPIFTRLRGQEDSLTRWDGQSVFDLQGSYGDYLLSKVSKVFPSLGEEHL
ncbi:MAG: 2-oxoglutarate and iron-dependent oxygenase domain-containing protein [Planctomycetota bacterium]|nr:2-oxoglutarate and iron-dependent oxygenase domain-containing protein [Planctomycetota bacterium]